jgi:hypothetical protein
VTVSQRRKKIQQASNLKLDWDLTNFYIVLIKLLEWISF